MEQGELSTEMSCLFPFTFSPPIPAMQLPSAFIKKIPKTHLFLLSPAAEMFFQGFSLLLLQPLQLCPLWPTDFYLAHHQSPQNVAAKIHSLSHCSFPYFHHLPVAFGIKFKLLVFTTRHCLAPLLLPVSQCFCFLVSAQPHFAPCKVSAYLP